jgi:hypothetical protein
MPGPKCALAFACSRGDQFPELKAPSRGFVPLFSGPLQAVNQFP